MTEHTPLTSPHVAAPVVFISSTVHDLADLRAGIGYVLRQRGVDVMMSEASDFPLYGDKSAFEECLENIRNSDLYVLIVDKRRGSLDEGISVTRHELRTARRSFAATGKPLQLLFARKGLRQLARRKNAALLDAGVDDPRHFRSFIKEITSPDDRSSHNFLKEFESFHEIMDSIVTRLNLGRNVAEAISRRAVWKELTANLARMVGRRGAGAFLSHTALTSMEGGFDFDSLNHASRIELTVRQRTRLMMGALSRFEASSFETAATREAVIGGVFLEYDPAGGELTPTKSHDALAQVLDDIKTLASLDSNDWHSRVILGLSSDDKRVVLADVAFALAFGYRAENLFNQMRLACWLLQGAPSADFPQPPRLPSTPLGPEEDLRMRKERVEPWEVEQLFEQDIAPFGIRAPWEIGESTREERIDLAYEQLRGIASANPKFQVDDAQLRLLAEEVVMRMTAGRDEGLKDPL